MISGLMQFSAVTPFRFAGLEDAARLLTAMGVSADKVLPLLTDIGNAVSATGRGAEGMQRVAYVMGEIQSLGQVDDRVLRQLTIDGGIPAFEMLAQAMHVSTQEVRKLASEGKITSDQFMEIFHDFVSQNWGDMMAKQARTFNGALTTLQDNTQIAIATAFDPLFEKLRDITVAAADASQQDSFKRIGTNGAAAMQSLADAAGRVPQDLSTTLSLLDEIDRRLQHISFEPESGRSYPRGTGAQERDLAGSIIGGAVNAIGSIPIDMGASAQGFLNGVAPGAGALVGVFGSLDQLLHDYADAQQIANDAMKQADAPASGLKTGMDGVGTSTRKARDEFEQFKQDAIDAARGARTLSDALPDLARGMQSVSDQIMNGITGGRSLKDWTAALAASGDVYKSVAPGTEISKTQIENWNRAAQEAIPTANKLGSSLGSLGQQAEASVPGLRAFDEMMFGTSQALAGVQLQIEQKKLDRMLKHPPHTLGQQERLLQEELTVEGLQRQVEFGPAIAGMPTRHGPQALTTGSKLKTGFASGGSFLVDGPGGTDAVGVSFMATRGERVSITPAGGGYDGAAGATSVTVNVNVTGGVARASDAEIIGHAAAAAIQTLLAAGSRPRSGSDRRLPGAQ
jgi:tape measure domain-containing protein